MKNFILVSGWIVAIALVILGFFQQQKMAALQTTAVKIDVLKTELAETTAKAATLEQQRDTLQASLAKVEPVESTTSGASSASAFIQMSWSLPSGGRFVP